MTRAGTSMAGLLLACVGLAPSARAEDARDMDVTLEEGFGPECVGWSMRDWTNPFRPGLRPDESVVRLEDGLMKVFLGRGMLGIDKSDLYHGKVVSRPLELYADFVVECSVKWDKKNAATMMEAYVGVHSGHIGVADAAFWGGGKVLGYWLQGPGRAALTGEAKIRFERTNAAVEVFWNDELLGQREAPHPITSISLTVKTYHTRRVEGSYAALDHLKVSLPKPSVELMETEEAEPSPNVAVGGDFEKKAKGAPGEELDNVMVEAEGLKGAGVGSLLGWETDIDGVQTVWQGTDSPLGKCLRLELKEGKGVSFASDLIPVEAGAEYEFSCLARAESPGVKITALPQCTVRTFTELRSAIGVLCRPDVARGVNDWNWKETKARFAIRDEKAASVEVALGALPQGEEGAVLFDSIVIRKLTQREIEKAKTAELRESLIPVQDGLIRTGNKLETALDVLGFDLDSIRDREEHPALAAETQEFAGHKQGIDDLRGSAKELYWKSAEVMQFFDRVTEQEIARVKLEVQTFRDEVSRFQKELGAQEKRLREELAALRPLRKRRTYKDNFEWARSRFHLYWQNAMGLDPPGFEDAFRYMGEMGTTVLHLGLPHHGRPYGKWESRDAYLQELRSLAEQEDIRIFGCFRPRVSPHPSGREAIHHAMKEWFDAFGGNPMFAGLEFDEINFGGGWCEECRLEFRKYLKKKYSKKELIELGIIEEKTEHIALDEIMDEEDDGDGALDDVGTRPPAPVDVESTGPIYDVDRIFPPEPEDRGKKKVLWMEHREFVGHLFEEGCRDAFEYAHSLKKDAIMMPLLGLGPIHNAPFSSSLARVSALGDMIAIDPYYDGIPEEAFFCDLMRANAKGPTIITVGTGMPYIRGNARSLKNDLCICFAHTDGMYVFDWIYVFKQRPYVTNNPVPFWTWWWRGAWQHVWDTFRKAHKIEKYLIQTESAAKVAMLYSERTTSVHDYREVFVSMGGRYGHQQMGLYSLLMQTHVQRDPIFAEGLTRKKLDRYAVLFVQNAAALAPEEEELIRSWVRDGGQLLVTASTSILDRWGRKQEDYRLGDVFGVKYVETVRAPKDATFGEDPKVSYLYGRLCDIVEPMTAAVVSKWSTGEPAVVTNSFGKGRCVFICAHELGLCYSGTSRPGMSDRVPVHKKFYPGVRELVSKLVLDGLKARGQAPSLLVRNCPDEVETVIRVQNVDGVQRRMLHLTNYSFTEPIQGVEIELLAPENQKLKLFYPVDNAPVEFKRKADRIAFTVRDFEVHEVIVIEPEK